jgi:hypothetical protein
MFSFTIDKTDDGWALTITAADAALAKLPALLAEIVAQIKASKADGADVD